MHVHFKPTREGGLVRSFDGRTGFLKSPSLAVSARVLTTSWMFITKCNALTMPLVLTTTQKTEFALLDSGATENFLDSKTVTKLRLPTQKLETPRTIYNIDGTNNKAGSITRKCQLKVQ